MAAKKGENANLMAAVAYFLMPITSIIIYLMEKDNKYVRFHAFQSLLFGVILFVASWILRFVFAMLAIATLGMVVFLAAPIMMLFWLACVVLWIFMMWKAYSGEKYKLPIIGDMAEKNA